MSTLNALPELPHRAFVGKVEGCDAPDRGGPEQAPGVGTAFRYVHKADDSDVAKKPTAAKPYSDGQVSIYYHGSDTNIDRAISAEITQGLREALVPDLTGYAVAKGGSAVFRIATFAVPST